MPSRSSGQRSGGPSGSRQYGTPPRNQNLPTLQPRTSPAGASAASPVYSIPNPSRPSPRTWSVGSTPGPPEAEKDGVPLEQLGFERRGVIEEASRILVSWDSLATLAMSRSESIPQTRMYLTNVIIKASDPKAEFKPPSTNTWNAAVANDGHFSHDAYAPRRHDPPAATSERRGSIDMSDASEDILVDHRTAKKDARRREEARARYLGRGPEEPIDRGNDGWLEISGIAWEDLKDFERFGTMVFPAREDPAEDQWSIKPITPSRRSRQGTPNSRESEHKIPRRSLSPQPKRERERERDRDRDRRRVS